jgi:iron complex outermembrane receptor protein
MEYELGVIHNLDGISLRASTWYYDIKDFINDNGITSPGSGAGSNCLYNIDNLELYGFELEAAIEFSAKLRANAGYVFQEYKVTQTGNEQDWTYYLPATLPKHKVKVMGKYEIIPEGWLQVSAKYVGARGTQKGGELEDYIVCDAGFEKKFKFGGLEYSTNVFVNNFTGSNYQEISGYSMPKQVWGLMMGVKF